MGGQVRFLLYSRPDCHLCDVMLEELATLAGDADYSVEVVNVDADPAVRRRWGLRIPVLMLDGVPVCQGRLDPEEVHKALAKRV